MADLPGFSDVEDAADDARQHARTLIPWLPDPPTCDACNAMRYASETFDPVQALRVKCWECRECDAPDTRRE